MKSPQNKQKKPQPVRKCSRCAATRKIIKHVASRIRDVIRGK